MREKGEKGEEEGIREGGKCEEVERKRVKEEGKGSVRR